MFKKISVSTALSATLMSTVLISSPVQAAAAEWQTISPADCRVSVDNAGVPAAAAVVTNYLINASGEVNNMAGAGVLVVDCTIPRTSIEDNVLKVYVNYINSGRDGSDTTEANTPSAAEVGPTNDPLVCTLTTTAYNGDASLPANTKTAAAFSDTLGFHSDYAEAQAYGWGSASVRCIFPAGGANSALLKSINYK